MSRPARALIDLDALRHNYALARRLHGGQVMAVLKANGYGHGSIACARALQGLADGYAVAFMQEASLLRMAGITGPILVLEGAFSDDDAQEAARHDCALVVHSDIQIEMLQRLRDTRPLRVWLKVDSGMHRAGFTPAQVEWAHARLRALPSVGEIGFMTHFARADEPASDMTTAQVACFDAAVGALPGPRSLCNSAGIVGWSTARRDWGRAGIMLYGSDPGGMLPREGEDALRAVMTLQSEIFAVRTLPAGEPVGYGARDVTRRDTRVGLIAMGYADGYPRNAPAGTPVAVDGQLAPLFGRVSMDMMTVDLTDLPQAGVGSKVELWGPQVPVDRVAEAAGMISYELLCNVKRVAFSYVSADAPAAVAAAARGQHALA